MIEQLEKDLESVVKAVEQAVANVNILNGQKQGLEHAVKAIKAAAIATEKVASVVEHVASAAEQVIDTSTATQD